MRKIIVGVILLMAAQGVALAQGSERRAGAMRSVVSAERRAAGPPPFSKSGAVVKGWFTKGWDWAPRLDIWRRFETQEMASAFVTRYFLSLLEARSWFRLSRAAILWHFEAGLPAAAGTLAVGAVLDEGSCHCVLNSVTTCSQATARTCFSSVSGYRLGNNEPSASSEAF